MRGKLPLEIVSWCAFLPSSVNSSEKSEGRHSQHVNKIFGFSLARKIRSELQAKRWRPGP
jgi:hypothetical protein